MPAEALREGAVDRACFLILVCLITLGWVLGRAAVYTYRRDWSGLAVSVHLASGSIRRADRTLGRLGLGALIRVPV
jgi:hypothetical protein